MKVNLIFLLMISIIGFSRYDDKYYYESSTLHKDAVYCIGIGKLSYDRGSGVFRASLCRIGSEVLKNVTVIHHERIDDSQFNVKEKLTFYTDGAFIVTYDKKNNVLVLAPDNYHPTLWRVGIFEPLEQMSGLVDSDLIDVYGSTFGLSTDTEEEYVKKFNHSVKNIKYSELSEWIF